ncbi:MAG: 30S ribosomal protein S4 [Candidatus Gracilibacteria bacterium]
MSRYTGSACKLCRREGVSICGSKKCALLRRNYKPGIHGNSSSMGKLSEFGKQLREKQKAKRIFGITERQFHKYYKISEKTKGVTGLMMLQLLESRLDNVVYRAGFAETRRQARQMVGHGHFKIAGRRITVPSLAVKIGLKIEVRDRSQKSPLFTALAEKKYNPPKWLKVDYKNPSIEVVADPDETDVEQGIDSKMIVEFYSK